jgi:hypothetical protein
MPNWVIDVSDCVTQSLSSDEEELPELDVDPRALLASKSSKICDRVSSSDVCGARVLDASKQKIGNSTGSACESNAIDTTVLGSKHNNQNISRNLTQSTFVFDPAFGVIPRETRDLWSESAKNNSRKSISPMKSVDSTLLDSSADRTSASAVTDKSIVKKMRVLPPVRYSTVAT